MSAAAVAIAAAALVLSVTTFFISRRRDKRDLFLRLHERLAAVDQQRGRKLIHDMRRDHKSVADLTDEEREAINNALATLNVACFYYERRYVSRKDSLQQWALPIVLAVDAAEPYLAYRDAQVRGHRTWPELRDFAADAKKYLQQHGKAVGVADHPITDELPTGSD